MKGGSWMCTLSEVDNLGGTSPGHLIGLAPRLVHCRRLCPSTFITFRESASIQLYVLPTAIWLQNGMKEGIRLSGVRRRRRRRRGYSLASAQDIYVHYTLPIIPSPATYHLVDIE